MAAVPSVVYVMKCDDPDGCPAEVYMGDGAAVFNSPDDARTEAHEQGWATSAGGWDYCPTHAEEQGLGSTVRKPGVS